jgi:UrcA family protein
MSFVNRHLSAAAQRIGSGLKTAGCVLASLALCAMAPAAFLTGKEGSASPATRSARVSLAGLDLSTSDGARDARERIHKAAYDLCARNPGQRSLDGCVDEIMVAARQQIRARTMKVSLADLDLSTPQGARAAGDRLRAAARRVCQELQPGSKLALTRYTACVDEAFAHALRQVDLLQRISLDF